jgi:hypothetical protein
MIKISMNLSQRTAISLYCANSQLSKEHTDLILIHTVFNIRLAQSARPRVVSADRMAEARSWLFTASPLLNRSTREREVYSAYHLPTERMVSAPFRQNNQGFGASFHGCCVAHQEQTGKENGRMTD